jgi:hypothetical protein
MRSSRAAVWSRASGIALVLAVSAPRAAHAWTETRVESAGAQLDVSGDGRAHVSLRIGVRVLGGWLSKLELAGLDPGLALDPDRPPSLLTEDGQQLTPEVRFLRGGRVVIAFPSRARAPHRGRHELLLQYSTTLASEPSRDGGRTLRWSLPAFSTDLRDVDVQISAPAGTRAAGEPDGAVTVSESSQGERAVLHWQRAQLPRTLVFEAALALPASVVRETLRSQQQERVPLFAQRSTWAVLLLLLLVGAKRAAVRASERAEHARGWPLLGLRGRPRALASIALAGAAIGLYPAQPWLGSAALCALCAHGLDRGFARLPQRPVRWTRPRYALELARLRRLRAARLLGTAAWLDATTPLGFSLLAACYALALQRALLGAGVDVWVEALLAATPLWLSATRFALPKSTLEDLLAQRRVAAKRQLAADASKSASPERAQPLAEPATPAGADRPGPARAA